MRCRAFLPPGIPLELVLPDPTVIAFLDKTRLSQIITNGLRCDVILVCFACRVLVAVCCMVLSFVLRLQQRRQVHKIWLRSCDGVVGWFPIVAEVNTAQAKHATSVTCCCEG
jgi:hypothetical protein